MLLNTIVISTFAFTYPNCDSLTEHQKHGNICLNSGVPFSYIIPTNDAICYKIKWFNYPLDPEIEIGFREGGLVVWRKKKIKINKENKK
jgi:hypothetical protein